jgi:nitroreductase
VTEAAALPSAPNPVLAAIRSRRMVRAMVDRPIERGQLEQVLAAARFAPNAGNRHLHRFLVVQDLLTLRVLRMVAPGMFQRPAAVVVICIDQGRAVSFGMRPTAKGLYIDVGTAARRCSSPPIRWGLAPAWSHLSAKPR